MTHNWRFDHDDLPLFAMQLLSREEETPIRAYIASSPEIQRELAEVRGDLAVYATTVELHSPPALARERLLAQIGRERKVRPAERIPDPTITLHSMGRNADVQESRFFRETFDDHTEEKQSDTPSITGRLVPWIGWAIAAGLAVTSGNFYHQSEAMREAVARDHAALSRQAADTEAARQLLDTLRDPSATHVTLTGGQRSSSPQGKVAYAADSGTLLFLASNLEPLNARQAYELWLIPASGDPPVAAGIIHPDTHGNASLVLPQIPSGLVARAFAVTIEDTGGAQTPTMPTILSGAAGS